MNHLGDRSVNQDMGDIPGWFDLREVLDPGIRTNPALPWNPPLGASDKVSEETSKNLHNRFDSGRKIYMASAMSCDSINQHQQKTTYNSSDEFHEVVLQSIPRSLGEIRFGDILFFALITPQRLEVRDTDLWEFGNIDFTRSSQTSYGGTKVGCLVMRVQG